MRTGTQTPIIMHMFETGTDDKISWERNKKSAIDHYEESAGLLGPDLGCPLGSHR